MWLPADFRAKMRAELVAATQAESRIPDETRERLTRRLEAVDRKEHYFLDLAAEEDWPKDKLRGKIKALQDEARHIRRTLDETDTYTATGRRLLETALDLLDDPGQLYARSGESVRVVLNKAFFARLYVDGRKITGEEIREPFALLRDMYEIYSEHRDSGRTVTIRARRTGQQDGPKSGAAAPGSGSAADASGEAEGSGDTTRGVVPKEDASCGYETLIHLPDGSSWDQGSNRRVMVEVAGIEPASFDTKAGLLRAQPAVLFSAPAITQASRRRAQPLFGFPTGPAAGPAGGVSLRCQIPGRRPPGLTSSLISP